MVSDTLTTPGVEIGLNHPLRLWRLNKGWTLDACAAGVGTVRQVWRDWEIGRRIPARSFMLAIYRFTQGEIEPNDFYDLPPIGQIELPIDELHPVPLLDHVA